LVGLVGCNITVTIWSVTGVIVMDLFDAYHLILLDISLVLICSTLQKNYALIMVLLRCWTIVRL